MDSEGLVRQWRVVAELKGVPGMRRRLTGWSLTTAAWMTRVRLSGEMKAEALRPGWLMALAAGPVILEGTQRMPGWRGWHHWRKPW